MTRERGLHYSAIRDSVFLTGILVCPPFSVNVNLSFEFSVMCEKAKFFLRETVFRRAIGDTITSFSCLKNVGCCRAPSVAKRDLRH